jgi:hypothetical protein
MAEWHEVYGMDKDAFVGVPDKPVLVGHSAEKDALLRHVNSRKILCLIGELGGGKTTMLKHVRSLGSLFGLKYVYYDCTPAVNHRDFNVRDVLRKHTGFLDRLLGRRVVLLVDEAHKLGDRIEDVKAAFESNELYSAVFTTVDLDNIVPSMRHRTYDTIILRALSDAEIVEILKTRMGSARNPFTKAALFKISELNSQNPRDSLMFTEKVLERACGREEGGDITVGDVERVYAEVVESAPGKRMASLSKFEKGGFSRDENIARLKAKLSNAQWAIIAAVAESDRPMSYSEIAGATLISYGGVSKHVSRLCLTSNADYMRKKGFDEPLMKRVERDGSPAFNLTHNYRVLLAKK